MRHKGGGMQLTYRYVLIGIAALGVALGVAFGAGVAYGRGDPREVQSGLTTQQIQSLLGINTAQAASSGAAPAGGGAAGTGSGAGAQRGQAAGAGGGLTALLGGAVAGRVTAVTGDSVTIETAQGPQKINLSAATSVSRVSTGTSDDIREGATIIASGTKKDDGSYDATSVSQLPAELQRLFGGGGNQQRPAPGATRTP